MTRLALHHLREVLLGPVMLALGAWGLLALLVVPGARHAALSAGDRVALDLGLLGLRLSWGVAAFALGASAVGPPLRRGEVRLLRAHGLSLPRWVLLRVLASGTALAVAWLVGLTVATLGGSLLGLPWPDAALPWAVLALLELAVVFGITTLCSTVLRGPVGPVLALVWLLVGRMAGALPGGLGTALGWLAPDLAALDGQAAVLGAVPSPSLLGPLLYGLGWVCVALGGTLVAAVVLHRADPS